MEILQPYLDEFEDIDEEVLLLDYCFQSKLRSTESDTVEESESKRHSFVLDGNANGGTTKILNSTLKERCDEEFPINAGGDRHMFEEDLNAQFQKLFDVDEKTFSVKSCETQEDEVKHEGFPAKYT